MKDKRCKYGSEINNVGDKFFCYGQYYDNCFFMAAKEKKAVYKEKGRRIGWNIKIGLFKKNCLQILFPSLFF